MISDDLEDGKYVFQVNTEEFDLFTLFILKSGYNLETKFQMICTWLSVKISNFISDDYYAATIVCPVDLIEEISELPNSLGKRMSTWLALHKCISNKY